MRRNAREGLLGAVIATVSLAILAIAGTAEASDFRLIEIDGKPVRWMRSSSERTTLSYAIARSVHVTPAAFNCGLIGPPNGIARHSQVSLNDIRESARLAFARWSAASEFDFVETSDQAHADIVIGEQLEPAGRAFTNLTFAENEAGEKRIARSQVCLNPRQRWKLGFDGNLAVYDLTHTLTHEIGHALGLDHPVARDQIMSFRYHERTTALGEGEIAGIAALYGPGEIASGEPRPRRAPSSQALK